jgi:SAM-dependent methyltransferase
VTRSANAHTVDAPDSGPRAREAAHEPERLDRGVPPAEAEEALRGLERVYRVLLLGGRDLRRLVLEAVAASSRRWCLDLGAGGGHVATDLERDAGRDGRAVRVVGVDSKLSHLLAGRRFGSPQHPVVADAAALPIRDGALACAFSHLFFHHFDVAGNRRVLDEMRRVAERAVIVDLRRSPILAALVRPGLRLLGLSDVAYEDGVVSVARSYDLAAISAVVDGMPVLRLERRVPFRWALVLRGDGG